jgi:hypothetical protein
MATSIHNVSETNIPDINQLAETAFSLGLAQNNLLPRTKFLESLLANREQGESVKVLGDYQDHRLRIDWVDTCTDTTDACNSCDIPTSTVSTQKKLYSIDDCVTSHFTVPMHLEQRNTISSNNVFAKKLLQSDKELIEKKQVKLLNKIADHVAAQSTGTATDPTLNIGGTQNLIVRGQTVYVKSGWGTPEMIADLIILAENNRMGSMFGLSGGALHNQSLIAGFNQGTYKQDIANAYNEVNLVFDSTLWTRAFSTKPVTDNFDKSFFLIAPFQYAIEGKAKWIQNGAQNPFADLGNEKFWSQPNRYAPTFNVDYHEMTFKTQVTNGAGTVNTDCEIARKWMLQQKFDMFFAPEICNQATGFLRVVCGEPPL